MTAPGTEPKPEVKRNHYNASCPVYVLYLLLHLKVCAAAIYTTVGAQVTEESNVRNH